MCEVIQFDEEFKQRTGTEIKRVPEAELAKPHITDEIDLDDKICPDCGSFMPLMNSMDHVGKKVRVCIYCNALKSRTKS